MARKKTPAPKPSRSEAFNSGTSPLRKEDLTPREWQTSLRLMSDASQDARSLLDDEELGTDSQRAALQNKPYRHGEAVQNIVGLVEQGARQGTIIDDADFYFDAHDTTKDSLPEGVPLGRATEASAALSVNNTPENEQAAAHALLGARDKGTVTYTRELADAMHENSRNKKGVAQTPKIPDHRIGLTQRISDLPSPEVAALKNPKHRDMATGAVQDVDIEGLARGGFNSNITTANDILAGEQTLNPYTRPKQKAYATGIEISTPEYRGEHNLRFAELADKVTGKVPKGQDSFDFFGMRHSSEGPLDPHIAIPGDKHQKRVSFDLPGDSFPLGENLAVTKKTRETKRSGAKEVVGDRDTRIQPEGIEAAVHTEEVHGAARALKQKYDLNFDLPALGTQAADWGPVRAEGIQSEGTPKKGKDKPKLDLSKPHGGYSRSANVGAQFQPLPGQRPLF